MSIHDENDPNPLGSQSLKDVVKELAAGRKGRHHLETLQERHRIARFFYGFIPVFVLFLILGTLAKVAAASLSQLMLCIG